MQLTSIYCALFKNTSQIPKNAYTDGEKYVVHECEILLSEAWLSAERVKVVVRVRPPNSNETGGAITVAPDNKGIVLYRE